MRVSSLQLQKYRNLSEIDWQPHPGVNVICGENGQGKTNLIESVWLCTGARGFRPGREKELIQNGQTYADIKMAYDGAGRAQEIHLRLGQKKTVERNGVTQKNMRALAGHFNAVIFSPVHLSIVKEGPALRRRFLDGAICQIRPAYIGDLYHYKKSVSQKNAVIKDVWRNADLMDLVDVFDRELAGFGARIYKMRRRYLAKMTERATEIYGGLAGEQEKLHISYESFLGDDIDEKTAAEQYYQALVENRKRDVGAGHCITGVHRDDIAFYIDDMPCRTYASQGQQRSVALSLKLAEGYLLREDTGEMPVMLLDDVMSELDSRRQDYLLNHLGETQVLITGCDMGAAQRLQAGSAVQMISGALKPL